MGYKKEKKGKNTGQTNSSMRKKEKGKNSSKYMGVCEKKGRTPVKRMVV